MWVYLATCLSFYFFAIVNRGFWADIVSPVVIVVVVAVCVGKQQPEKVEEKFSKFGKRENRVPKKGFVLLDVLLTTFQWLRHKFSAGHVCVCMQVPKCVCVCV